MKAKSEESFDILQIQQASLTAFIVGKSPLIYHAMSEKAKRELLLPRGRQNTAARAQSLKHDPLEEYRDSVYRWEGQATRLMLPAAMFKEAMKSAALDIPGATKAAIGRLTWVVGDAVPLYGVPELLMSVVRSADINKTPDIRTRAIVRRWATAIKIDFVQSILSERSVVHLLAAAGVLSGVGDYRQSKGSGSYGQFRLADPDDAEFAEIVKEGALAAQDKALKEPAFYNEESRSLYEWSVERIAEKKSDRGAVDEGTGREGRGEAVGDRTGKAGKGLAVKARNGVARRGRAGLLLS